MQEVGSAVGDTENPIQTACILLVLSIILGCMPLLVQMRASEATTAPTALTMTEQGANVNNLSLTKCLTLCPIGTGIMDISKF